MVWACTDLFRSNLASNPPTSAQGPCLTFICLIQNWGVLEAKRSFVLHCGTFTGGNFSQTLKSDQAFPIDRINKGLGHPNK
jgi:hypothetical protein